MAAATLLMGLSGALADSIKVETGNINQNTYNGHSYIENFGTVQLFGGKISGDGASVSISATGAASSVSASFIGAPEFDEVSIADYGHWAGSINQVTTNKADVTNANLPALSYHGYGHYGYGHSGMDVGRISGDGASVSVGATGAVSSVSVSSIGNTPEHSHQDTDIGNVNQTTTNKGTILNYGGKISTGTISGDGASVSIAATGAASAVSVSSIADCQPLGHVDIGNVSQTTQNYAPVTNIGQISTRALTGNGSSVSVSAVGAASAVSISAIK
jgi:hypothetical protein